MILIGTSGYSFPDWVGPFYPLGTDRGKMLDHYVQHFPTVEVNATYYRIPPPSTLHAMERKTPPGFEFVVKAHHDMTHKRSLDDEIYQAFARSVDPLLQAGKLSGVLAQFPYAFRRTRENEKFLGEMKQRLPEAHLFVEFRHNSWVRDERHGRSDDIFSWLEEQGLGYVSVDEPDLPGLVPPVARATGSVGYVRLHVPPGAGTDFAKTVPSAARIRPRLIFSSWISVRWLSALLSRLDFSITVHRVVNTTSSANSTTMNPNRRAICAFIVWPASAPGRRSGAATPSARSWR